MATGDPTRPGVVSSFDAVVGLGEVTLGGGRRVAFHATALTDGSRSVGVGAAVRVTLGPSLGGVEEARSVTLDGPSFPCPVCRHAVPGDVEIIARGNRFQSSQVGHCTYLNNKQT